MEPNLTLYSTPYIRTIKFRMGKPSKFPASFYDSLLKIELEATLMYSLLYSVQSTAYTSIRVLPSIVRSTRPQGHGVTTPYVCTYWVYRIKQFSSGSLSPICVHHDAQLESWPILESSAGNIQYGVHELISVSSVHQFIDTEYSVQYNELEAGQVTC